MRVYVGTETTYKVTELAKRRGMGLERTGWLSLPEVDDRSPSRLPPVLILGNEA